MRSPWEPWAARGKFAPFEGAGLAGRQAILLTSTGDVTDFLYHVHRGMLELVGYSVLEPVITYGPAHLSDPDRAEALDAVAEAFANIDHLLRLSQGRALVAQH